MHDLHTDIVLGRNHTFEIWAKSEMEKGVSQRQSWTILRDMTGSIKEN